MQAIHLIIIVRKRLVPLISDVECMTLGCGISNSLGNKGAVSISMKVGQTKLLCISCHLAAGQSEVVKRSQDFEKIYNAMVLQHNANSPKVSPLNTPIDNIIWVGDFNYRINGIINAI